MRKYRLYQVDAFTEAKFAGNPAGVIADATGLTDREMQQIARELNNSETAFVFTSDSDAYDVHVRFFTPRREVPICGHATIAAHYVRAVEGRFGTTRVIQRTGAGILPVDVIREGGDYRIVMTQGRIEFGAVIDGADRTSLLAALALTERDLMADWPVQIVSTGHSKVMIGIRDVDTLNRLNPDQGALARLSDRIGCNGYYVFTPDTGDKGILACGRMFAPAIGIAEDPVTGNANGPLGAYLVHYGFVRHDGRLLRFSARQGEAMGRPGTVSVDVAIQDAEPAEVKVAGRAVIAFQTELALP